MGTIVNSVTSTGYLVALDIFVPLFFLWKYLRKRKPKGYPPPPEEAVPLPISFGPGDHMKAFISWLLLFMRVFWITPGLYHTGKYDPEAPLLVTANNFLTVFLLARRLGNRNTRLLVVDSDGINVWCAAGKGVFGHDRIIEAARRHNLLNPDKKEKIIIPKFGASGIKLEAIRDAGLAPIIGPLYASDLPAYLDEGKLRNRTDDHIRFGLRSRAFTALPTAFQFFFYFLGVYVFSLGLLPLEVIPLATGIAFTYPLLFSILPGRWFTVKALWMSALAAVLHSAAFGFHPKWSLVFICFFTATSLFLALSYTGNSAVSNYTAVRKETARFLPIIAILYILFIGIYFLLPE